ncbi:Homocysteine S-methyltransferase YbgG [Portunus trituberculatus]|uniref:Homocysteine S-methyltransferase YbgG n=1 Tax=Portunus trituberculatus TaxID=210409 RepID=A0A5B7GXC2_PORTR|nr:Homocysteine S-methyltransferase YbgG [Portunus trituberculatus]
MACRIIFGPAYTNYDHALTALNLPRLSNKHREALLKLGRSLLRHSRLRLLPPATPRLVHTTHHNNVLMPTRATRTDHHAFLEAGAEVLVCGSYQASVSGFQQHLSTTREEALALIGRSATLALDAVQEFEKGERGDHPKVVAGSVGPYGACQADGSEYTGSYIPSMTQSDLMTWHRPRLEALAGAGLRVVALETLPALSEALALLGLLREFPDLKAWVTFSCKVGGSGGGSGLMCMVIIVVTVVVMFIFCTCF